MTIENRAAGHEYFILDTIECGIELRGNEVKSIRDGKASIKESWVSIEKGEMFLRQMHITPWETANRFDVDADRDKKLLAHKDEIAKLYGKVRLDGLTLIPLRVYFNKKGKCKVSVGVCKGKKLYDKRESAKEAVAQREIERDFKNKEY